MVVFVGGLNGTFNSAEGEGHDRTSLELLGFQHELMVATHRAARAAGASFVVVLIGSPVVANWAQANADAVLAAGYGGQEAGNSIWDVLLGDCMFVSSQLFANISSLLSVHVVCTDTVYRTMRAW